ncbi:MAG: phage tail tape measure protein [FCB group bacterium]|nr:phage tail tape measure protein [FCB group bacterium]
MSMLEGFTQFINIKIAGTSTLGGAVDDAVSALDRLEKRSKTMFKLGAGLAVAGAGMMGLGVAAAMSTNATTTALGELASVSVKNLAALEEAARKFTNQWSGMTKSEFISAAYDIKSGIYSLSDEGVAKFTEFAALTAKATKATVAEMTSLFATGYGIYKSYYGKMTDFEFGKMFAGGIASAVQAFKTTGPQMAAAISNLGASATSALVPMEEQLAILGTLQATMSGSEAGTKYRAFMKSAAKAGMELGMSFTDAGGKLRPMVEILKLLKARYGETITAMQKVKLQEAFGRIESVALIDLLLPQIDALGDSITGMKASMQGGTSVTTQMALAMSDNLGAALGVLKNITRNTFEEIGKTVLPMVRAIVAKVTSAVEAFQNWVHVHPGLVKLGMAALIVGGAILTVGGGLAMAAGMAGLMITGIINLAVGLGIGTAGSITFAGALWGVASALWGVISPFLPIIGAIALLYFAFKSNFLGIRDTLAAFMVAMKALWAWIKPVFIGIKTLVDDVIGKVIKAVTGWFTDWNSQFEGGRAPLLRLTGVIAYAIGFIVGIFQKLFGFFKEHEVLGGALLTVFAGSALGVMRYVKASSSLMSALKGLPHALRMGADSMKFLSQRMREFDPATIGSRLKNAFTSGAAYVHTGVSNIITSLGRGLKSAWAFSSGMVKSTIRWSGEVFRASLRLGKGLAQLGVQFLKTAGNVALYGAKMIWAGVQATGQLIKGLALTSVGLLRQGAAFVASKVAMLAGAVASNIMTASQWALNAAMSVNPIGLIIMSVIALIGVIILLVKNWDKVWSGIKTGIYWIWGALKWFTSAVAGLFTTLVKPLIIPFMIAWNIIRSIFTPIVGFFVSIFEKIAVVFTGVADAIKSFFSSIWDSIKGAVFGFANFFLDKINWLIGVANKIPGVNIPLIPKLEISKPPEMQPAKLGVELYEFTKSDNLVSKSPWTVKTSDASLKLGIEETKEPKVPLLKAIIEPIFQAIPVITVFARAILLEPLDNLFGVGPELSRAGGYALPKSEYISGKLPPPAGGESYITHAQSSHTATTNSRTVVDRRVGPVNIIIQGGDPRNVRRELERFFEDLAAQGEAIEGLGIA